MPGIILEGGTFRPIFSAGVMDALLDEDIMFPYMIGVSAGICDGNAEPWEGRSRRDLRILGCLRSGNQRRYVCIYLVWGDATDGGILGTFESDDIKSTGSDFAHRRSEVL